ncbi:T9SS type A sorting domain-containing protein [Winogradskyella maritima]|uniref:T9SS type A sorting domain-containing protein n=1 Tax=Winogradskyella maritima TaxID=1517766 RepID=A0ABV8AKT6_9FLAO|nr:T9SS type A sorting domain-containing protein [Winogradskyella maritima]
MKKITFLIVLFSSSILMAQTWTTGTVLLDPGSGGVPDYTVKFDINQGTNTVTMTMIGPSNVWLGVGPGITAGNGMGNLDDDAIVFNSNGLEDRNMPSGTGTPPLDNAASPMDEWSLVSNTISGSQRTVIATRAINTGDSEDFVFPTSATSLPILWAHGNGTTSFGYHGGSNKSGVVANLTLSNDEFNLNQRYLSLYPNPAEDELTVNLTNYSGNFNFEVYDILGKRIMSEFSSDRLTPINIQSLRSGTYLIRISGDDFSETRRFIKN